MSPKLCRALNGSCGTTGDRAEISKERLYESKDSRDIEKGSISDKLLRDGGGGAEGFVRLGQKLFFSGGEGGR